MEFWNWYENEESIFLAMEYFPLGTLGAFIEKKINEDDTRSIAAQLLEGLHIMHSHGFTHRDLKPEVRSETTCKQVSVAKYYLFLSEHLRGTSITSMGDQNWGFRDIQTSFK